MEEQHLIDNLGYLASTTPRGAESDPAGGQGKDTTSFLPTAYATLLAGVFVNVFVLMLILWIVARPIGWGLMALNDGNALDTPVDPKVPLAHTMTFHAFVMEHHLFLPGLVLAAVGGVLGLFWVLSGQKRQTRSLRPLMNTLRLGSYAGIGLGLVLILILWVYPEIVGLVDGIDFTKVSFASIAAAAGVVGATVRTVRVPLARIAPYLGGTLFVGLMVAVAAYMTGKAAQDPLHWGWTNDGQNSGWPWLIALVLLALLQVWISPETWSLAAFYREAQERIRDSAATGRQRQDTRTPLPERQRDRHPGRARA